MKKYLWSPTPLAVGGLIALLLKWRGLELIAAGQIEPWQVSTFAGLFLVVGLAMTAVWLCGCVVHDVHQWFEQRPIRRMLREDEEGLGTKSPGARDHPGDSFPRP